MLIYLDFDGVLHRHTVYLDGRNRPTLQGPGKLFEYAPRLEQVLAPYPGVEIVLSTSWVRLKGYHYCCKRLPLGLRRRVIGATWHSQFEDDAQLLEWWLESSTRYEQIIRDVRRRDPDAWLAVDDDATGWPDEARGQLISCDPDLGMSEPSVRLSLEYRLAKRFGLSTPENR